MPLNRSLLIYSGQKLLPLHKPEEADEQAVNLAPNTRFRRGQVVGQVTGSANDVQTITVTGGPAGGTVTILLRDPRSGAWGTFVLPYNATNTVAQGLIRALLGPNVVVTGGPLPGTPLVVTASGSLVNMPIHLMSVESSALTGGTTPALTIAHTTLGRSAATFAPYLDTNSDGTQVAKGVIAYECSTDSGGWITPGPVAIEGVVGESTKDAPMYIKGYFRTSDLIGLDAAAVTDLGRLVNGTVSNGEIWIG